MDQTYKHQNKKSLTGQLMNMNSQFLKRVITKLLLYVSVFSLLFSHPTCSSLLHNFNFYFSTLPLKLASHTLDKHYTFLICNGLLVFLAKYSGLFSSSSSSSSSSSKHVNSTLSEYYSYKSFEDDSQPEMVVMEAAEVPLLEKEAERESTFTTYDDEEAQQNEHKHIEVVLTVEPESTTDHHHENFMVEEDRLQGEEAFVEEEEEEDGEEELNEEEENGMLSTEELNKKFDEFIWKMKEELRIEAQK